MIIWKTEIGLGVFFWGAQGWEGELGRNVKQVFWGALC